MVTKGSNKNVEARPRKRSVAAERAADGSSTRQTERQTALLVTTESERDFCLQRVSAEMSRLLVLNT
jgi:hypothetical protein